MKFVSTLFPLSTDFLQLNSTLLDSGKKSKVAKAASDSSALSTHAVCSVM